MGGGGEEENPRLGSGGLVSQGRRGREGRRRLFTSPTPVCSLTISISVLKYEGASREGGTGNRAAGTDDTVPRRAATGRDGPRRAATGRDGPRRGAMDGDGWTTMCRDGRRCTRYGRATAGYGRVSCSTSSPTIPRPARPRSETAAPRCRPCSPDSRPTRPPAGRAAAPVPASSRRKCLTRRPRRPFEVRPLP